MMIDSWDKVDLKTHKKLYEISTNVYDTEEDKRFKTAAYLNGITYEEFLEAPITAATQMMASTAFLYEKPKPVKIKREYTLNGTTYCPFKDVSEMTTAQYIDYQSIIVEKFEEHLVELMSIILVPKGHIYNDGYDSEKALEDIETLSVTEALGLADFFLKKYRRSLRRTLLYSKAAMWMAVRQAPKELREEMKEQAKKFNSEADALLSMCGYLSLKQLLK